MVRAVHSVVCCDVCKAGLRLTKSLVVAAAEVLTFADAHGEHSTWALTIRDDATCQCPRRTESSLVSLHGDEPQN